MTKRSFFCVFILLSVLVVLVFGLSITRGAVNIPSSVLWSAATPREESLRHILLCIRLPRATAALLVGASLAIAGAAMQGLFRNPLVDPGIVGIMNGAALFVSLTVVIVPAAWIGYLPFSPAYVLPLSAFIGGWCSTMLLYRLSKRNGQLQIMVMLLLGIALAAFAGAVTGLLVYLADDRQMRSLAFWGMGSLAGFDWYMVGLLSLTVAVALPCLMRQARALNAMMLGEQVAGHLGFDIAKSKSRLIIWVALLSGVCVAFSGSIAFVGLIVPHIMRSILGADHRVLLPGCALCGAVLLMLADLFARIAVTPAELPIGIVTSLIGAPFLAYLIWQRAKRGGV